MNQKLLLVLTVFVSVPLAWFVLLEMAKESPSIQPEPGGPDWGALEARLTAVEGQLARLHESNGPSRHSRDETHEEVEALVSRLSQVEDSLAILEEVAGEAGPETADAISSSPPPPQERIDRAVGVLRDALDQRLYERAAEVILDQEASSLAKVESQKTIRSLPDAYTDAMVEELVRIGEHDGEESIRANVWKFFDGAANLPVLIEPLLRAANYDESDRVRSEAAETLAKYADDPVVLEALQWLAENDSSPDVRRKALRELQELDERSK